MFEENMKGKLEANKFYVGTNSVLDIKLREGRYKTWGHETLEQSLEHANRILEKNPDQEYCFIVEIIKVVRRKPVELPIVVEDV
jgi:hypothetical protein